MKIGHKIYLVSPCRVPRKCTNKMACLFLWLLEISNSLDTCLISLYYMMLYLLYCIEIKSSYRPFHKKKVHASTLINRAMAPGAVVCFSLQNIASPLQSDGFTFTFCCRFSLFTVQSYAFPG